MQMIDMEAESRLDDDKPLPVKMLAGNKCDLQASRQIRSAQGLEWARSRGCGFMETSARDMVNIEETFAGRLCRILTTSHIADSEYSHRKTSRGAAKTTRKPWRIRTSRSKLKDAASAGIEGEL